MVKSNLNAGNGKAWAGQLNDKDDPKVLSNVEDFVSDVNFGIELPIGSNKYLVGM